MLYHHHLSPSISNGGSPPNYNLCLQRANKRKSLLAGQHWRVSVSTEEYCFCVHLCFSSSACLVRLTFMVLRWAVSGLTAAVLCGAAFKVCSKHYITFLYCSHLAFSPCVLLASLLYIHTVVLTFEISYIKSHIFCCSIYVSITQKRNVLSIKITHTL